MEMVKAGEGKIVELARAAGKTPEQFIEEKRAAGQTIFGIAWQLGVYPNAVRYWIKKAKLSRTR